MTISQFFKLCRSKNLKFAKPNPYHNAIRLATDPRVCPVSALANAVLGHPQFNCQISAPAEVLGLTEDDARKIARAADSIYDYPALRQHLLTL